jgi:flagellar hook-basal body complex protein FliE
MAVSPVSSVSAANPATPLAATGPQSAKPANNLFARVLDGANQQQLAAEKAVDQLAQGGETSLQNVVLTATRADLSFRLILELRNKLIESYQEIMRMQV